MQFKDEDGINISVNPNSHGVTPIGEWCHNAYVCTVTTGTGNMYVNGVSRINNPSGSTTKPLMSVDAPISLGNRGDNTAAYAFPGIVDEVRISSVVRSQDWPSHVCTKRDNGEHYRALCFLRQEALP